MVDQVLETWRIHDGINRYLLDHLPEAGLAAIPLLKNGQPGKGRNVARSSCTVTTCALPSCARRRKRRTSRMCRFSRSWQRPPARRSSSS
jgi:hypothetical protein